MLEMGVECIVGVTGLISVCFLVRKAEWLLQIVMKASIGIVCIYGINMLSEWVGVPNIVGLNWVTIGCSAVLGVPGVIMLYAIAKYIAI